MQANFAGDAGVSFPGVVTELVSPAVLVEAWVPGTERERENGAAAEAEVQQQQLVEARVVGMAWPVSRTRLDRHPALHVWRPSCWHEARRRVSIQQQSSAWPMPSRPLGQRSYV